MKKGKELIPSDLIKFLSKYSIPEEEICYAARYDIDDAYRFADGLLVLTKDKLVLLAYPAKNDVLYRFGGYISSDLGESLEPAIKVYELEKIEKLEIIREVGNGVIAANIEGSLIRLCQFSNTKMAEFDRMKQNLDKVKKKEELTKDDIEGKKSVECCPKCGGLYPDQERKICPKCMDKKSIFIRMLLYFKEYKAMIVIMFICYILTAVLNLVGPYLSGTVLYDKILGKNEAFLELINVPVGKITVLLLFVMIGMFISKLFVQIFRIIQSIMIAKIAPDVVSKMKKEVFNSMGKLSISFYNSKQTGGLMTRVIDDSHEVTGFFIDGIPQFFTNVFIIISTCIVMIALNPLLAAVSLVLLPFLTVVSYRMMPRLWHFYGKKHRANRRLNSQMNDNITGARVVKAFGQEESELKRFGKNNKGVKTSEMSIASYDNKFYAMYSAVENAASFLVWGLGSVLVLNGSGLELGLLITFSGYVGQLNGPLDFMSYMFRWWTNSMNSAQRIFEIVDAVSDVKESINPVRPEKIEGEIELKGVTFSYEPHKPVLKDVSFKVKAGEMLGIVGRSGSGKSTLVNLISRLYDAEEGDVLIDGINVREIGFKELRKSVAMVSQETYIFMGTVAENIAYSRPDALMKDIITAAIQSGAHDFICKMPEGYDTIIGHSGRTLSGGERQRVSIARAILADPRILILDEATSAVDTETELVIQESLEKLVKGRTTLSIAHRLSTLRNADKLIVIEDGKVTEEGTHAQLVELKGTYHKLMELQTKALAMRGIS